MPENNEENRAKLAEAVVDAWDMDTLVNYAIEHVQALYESDNEKFLEDWGTTFGG